MEDSFGLLEQKVRKAAELVERLREENRALHDDLRRVQVRLKEIEKAGAGERPSPPEGPRLEHLSREIKTLRAEREEVRARIAKLIEILDELG